MAIVKLVCQGCGANLDADSSSRVVECTYCHSRNAIGKPAPAAPPPRPRSQYQQPPSIQIHLPSSSSGGASSGRRGKFALLFALIPIVVIGVVGISVFSFVKTVTDQVVAPLKEAFGGRAPGAAGEGANYSWVGARPFLVDVDGDGTRDLLGIVHPLPGDHLELQAISGRDWTPLWHADLGTQGTIPGQPRLRFADQGGGPGLALFTMGASLHAYNVATGEKAWIASLPDMLSLITLDGDGLWIKTLDGDGHRVALGDGSITPASAEPPASAKPMRTDGGYSLIPAERNLDLSSNQFEGLRIEVGFCPIEDQGVAPKALKKRRCDRPGGLAFATRAKGTQIPYLVAYERESKAERWRVQLTTPGSLETVDSGFGQPRAEFQGDEDGDVFVSFVPDNEDNARIRRVSMVDGATRWEAVLTRRSTENVNGMIAGEHHLYVVYGPSLIVLDIESGERLRKLGGIF